MKTEIVDTKKMPLTDICRRVKEIWENGGTVAFPTETVYGLGGNGLNKESSMKIYAAKGRPSDNPLILHIAERAQLDPLVKEIPEKAVALMEAFWPGPLTMIFKKADIVPKETSGGLDTIAVRMPVNGVAHALLKACKLPIAAPSANLSGRPSTTCFSHVYEDLNGRVDCIVADEDSEIGLESTIVDVTGETPMILRPGYITKEMLEKIVGKVEIDPAILNDNIIHHRIEIKNPKAPGMKYRHYAPKAPLTVVYGPDDRVLEVLSKKAGPGVGILTCDEHIGFLKSENALSLGSKGDLSAVSKNLYKALRMFDTLEVQEIYAEDFSECDKGGAVMNRLLKAAGGAYKKYDEV